MHVQHPFAGILQAEDTGDRPDGRDSDRDQPVAAPDSRRSFFGRALAAAAGRFGTGFLAAHGAAAQYTLIGPRGQQSSISHWPRYHYGDRRPTTYALGEEGSGYRPPPPPPPRYTTYALGEEGSHRPWPPSYGGGGRRYRPAPITTYALGEEGGHYRRW